MAIPVSVMDLIYGQRMHEDGRHSAGLGYKGINRTVRSAVEELMADGRVGYLYPDSPRSPKQRICLNPRGRRGGQTPLRL